MMSARKFALPVAALAGALVCAAVVPGQAVAADASDEVYLAAGLRGANEVGTRGDQDGRATVVLRISDGEVTFAARWNKIGTPAGGHVHAGAKGVNGDVALEFFTRPLPRSVLGVTGTIKADPALVKALTDDPGAFYANLHDAAHPKGAVRGQFHRLSRPVDLHGVLQGSNQATLSARADAAQEVRADDGQRRGDADGRATWWLRPHGSAIGYTATWSGLGRVTAGHLHKAAPGANGPVAVDLFAAKGLPENLTGVAGDAPADPAVVKRIAAAPGRYYANLRTADFDGGAVRGQLSGRPFAHPRAVTADVLRGAQIYACTRQPSGGYAFTQHGVTAGLRRGIDHSFVTPAAGPPQWIAPDRSAVRGAVVTRTPNGAGNIPELVLDATQAGAPTGLLAHTTQILRLNTEGGLAPAGSCTPGSQARVPYGADYVFLG
ncbi:CHRD domain-containing protein [Nonomuraea sp. NN258]|uniref:CHRD domain-containing protein n=1 Tax=Nonomuraea antri TaxID=2730852 RepID=UPI001567E33D|nr:CHRD domain-containing protein [Nonomuraea antri]NRQ30527.1 CHRD domain-containing protein [Nonomuraea antri]